MNAALNFHEFFCHNINIEIGKGVLKMRVGWRWNKGKDKRGVEEEVMEKKELEMGTLSHMGWAAFSSQFL